MNAPIIWLTGLSGSGKTTLAKGLAEFLRHDGPVSVLDGDELRPILSPGLKFTDADRKENIRRVGEVALMLAQAGVTCIVAMISPFRVDRRLIRDRAVEADIPFYEVYVEASLATCRRRDPKGIYRMLPPNLTGVSSAYEAPTNPVLVIQTEEETVDRSIDRLVEMVAVMK